MLCTWLPAQLTSAVLDARHRGWLKRSVLPVTDPASTPTQASVLLIHFPHILNHRLQVLTLKRAMPHLEIVPVLSQLLAPLDWQPVTRALRVQVALRELDLTCASRWTQLELELQCALPSNHSMLLMQGFCRQAPPAERHCLSRLVELALRCETVKECAPLLGESTTRLPQRFQAAGLSAPKILLHAVRTTYLVDLLSHGAAPSSAAMQLRTDLTRLRDTYRRTAGTTLEQVSMTHRPTSFMWVQGLLSGQTRYVEVRHAYQALANANLPVPSWDFTA